ncbi:MAG TPA: hypothetical protein VMT75_07340 [Candidatus Saccharimonadales bacterium]|nr:hypothetical protein [Candidatus Saccharimonadales bacterium]
MRKLLTGTMLMMALAYGASAQVGMVEESRGNAAADFGATSASQVTLSTDAAAREADLTTSEASSTAAVPEAAAAPAPAAKPKFVFGDRDDYRWQLGVGFEYLRFRSTPIDSSLLGLNTTLSYFTNSWFALEGNVITAFGTSKVDTSTPKFFGGAGGFRIGGRRQKWEPWAHGLVGGSHLQPQTALGGRNALMAQAGIGVDYRIHARLSLRGQGDWVFTNYFSQNQNSFQVVAGVVFHF